MAGPWEQYQNYSQPTAGPWQKYSVESPSVRPAISAEQMIDPIVPKPPRTLGQDARSFMQGIYQLPNNIAQSGVELIARGTDAAGLSNSAYDMFHKGFRESSPDNAAFKTGEIVGDIVGTLPLGGLKVVKGAGRLAQIANGAAQGGATSLITSSQSDAPLTNQLMLGTGAGAAFPLLAAGASAVKTAVPEILGNVTTGAGANSVRQAFQAGKAGGAASQAFTDSMRGNTPWAQVVDDAKGALSKMREVRNREYRSGMLDISKDKSVLDFRPIDDAISQSNAVKSFKGKELSPKTADVRSEIKSAIDEWRSLDPAEYHTPEGFDALKQRIGDIRDALPYNTPQRVVADQAYNAVRKTIADQAPGYNKVMAKYAEASDLIDDIQRELSLKPNANVNTALRKLQSVMRDGVNTSFGDRAKYADALSEAGATNILPSLAGQSLSSLVPRGLAKYGDIGIGAGLYAAGASPAALPALAMASPRLAGEGAHALGTAARNVNGLLAPLPKPALNISPILGLLGPSMVYQGAQ